jgi:thioredoxin 1
MLMTANTKEVFLKAIALNELVVVDVYASWCPPCKALAPILEQVQELCYIVKVNNDEVSEVADEYNVTGLPTLLFFKSGELLDRVVGLINQPDLEAKINKLK